MGTVYIKYEFLGKQKLPRLKTYNDVLNQYDLLHMNGFEFTHHDVLSDMAVRETFENRCKKIMLLADCNLFIFYHHRYCKSADRRLLMQHLLALKKLYLKRCPKVEVVMFTQVIVDDPVERREERSFINGIHTYVFHTTQVWSGNDQNVFWPAEMMICCGK